MTLLETARSTDISRKRKPVTQESIDLAMALMTGEISGRQAAAALGCDERNAHSRCQSVILSAIRRGMVNVSVKE